MALYQVSSGDRILAADINQFYSILKGVAASGEAVTLIYNAAGSIIVQPSSDPAAGTEAVQVKNNAGTVQSALSYDGRLYPADGLVGTPGIAYELDKDTGLYRISANASALVAGGAEKLRWDATGVSFDGGATYMPTIFSIDNTTLSYWHWFPGVQIESTLTGTGTYTTPSNASYGVSDTGLTTGGAISLRKATNGAFGTGLNGTARIRWVTFLLATDKGAAEVWRVFFTDEFTTAQPSLTAKHLGLKFDGTTLSFSTADGATEQTTSVGASFTANTDYYITITFDGTTARLYVAGTLVATHATNVPTTAAGITPIFRSHIVSSANANKVLYLGPVTMRMAT